MTAPALTLSNAAPASAMTAPMKIDAHARRAAALRGDRSTLVWRHVR